MMYAVHRSTLLALTSAVALLTAGCGGEPTVAEVAAARFDVPEEELHLEAARTLAPTDCQLVSVWDTGSTNPHPAVFAVLEDGKVVEGFRPGAAEAVLDRCFFDVGLEPTGQVMAEVVIGLSDKSPGPIAVAKPSSTDRLRGIGVDYVEPTLTTEVDGRHEVTFLARDLELGGFLRVVASRAPDGELTISFEDLG